MSPQFFTLLFIAVFAFFGVTCSSKAQTIIAADTTTVPIPVPIHVLVLDPYTDYRFTGIVKRNASGATLRSPKVVSAFKALWACPATGLHTGACAGWAVDHVIPLDCGGADAVYNMQWLPDQIKSAAGPFTKDHFERKIYGGNGLSKGCP
jgi:hypothetical protein